MKKSFKVTNLRGVFRSVRGLIAKRHNIAINKAWYLAVTASIRDGGDGKNILQGYEICKPDGVGNRSTVWLVRCQKQWLALIFNQDTQKIMTVIDRNKVGCKAMEVA